MYLVKRLTKGDLNKKIPRYADIWEMNVLLDHLSMMHPADTLDITDLTTKTVALVFILSLYRSLSVAAIGPSYQLMKDNVILHLVSPEKTSRPNKIRGGLQCPHDADTPEL